MTRIEQALMAHRPRFPIMARPSRWSSERQANREQAEWIVGWLRRNGPATTPEVIAALEADGREVRAHVLQRALRRSPFVHCIGKEDGERGPVSRWAFAVDPPNEP
jgi:hypothetical protein